MEIHNLEAIIYTFSSIYCLLVLIDKNPAWTENTELLGQIPTMLRQAGYQSVTETVLYKNSRINVDIYAAITRHHYKFVLSVFMPSLDARRYFVKP